MAGSADRRQALPGQRCGQGGAHGGLGRSVAVDQAPAGGPGGRGGRWAGFADHDQRAQAGQLVRAQGGQRARGHQQVGDPRPPDDLGQLLAEHRSGARRQHQGGAVEQGAEHLGDHAVEAQRGELQHPVARAEGEVLAVGGDERGDAAMRDDHALGCSGRPGGEDHVRRVVHRQRRWLGVGARVGWPGTPGRWLVDGQRPEPGEVGQPCREIGGGEHRVGLDVGEQRADPARRGVRVDGQERSAGLEHGQHRDHPVHRAGQEHGHHPLGCHAAVAQAVGQARHPPGQVRVGQRLGSGAQCHGVRVAGHRGVEQVHGGGRRDRRGSSPPPRQAVPFPRHEHVHLADALGGVGGHGGQHAHQPVGALPHGRVVEQVPAVLDDRGEPVGRPAGSAAFDEGEAEVELGHVQVHGLHVRPQVRQVEPDLGEVLQHQHDLEQRLARGRAFRVDGLDHQVQRHVLVGVGGEVHGADPVQQVGHGRVTAGVGAQDQGVDEEAHQIVQCGVGPAGDRAADGDVGARAQPGEQHRQRGVQHHEQRDVVGAGQVQQVLVQPRVHLEGHHPAPV